MTSAFGVSLLFVRPHLTFNVLLCREHIRLGAIPGEISPYKTQSTEVSSMPLDALSYGCNITIIRTKCTRRSTCVPPVRCGATPRQFLEVVHANTQSAGGRVFLMFWICGWLLGTFGCSYSSGHGELVNGQANGAYSQLV